MALTSIRMGNELEGAFVLAPERYDPRRESLQTSSTFSIPLRKVVTAVRRTITASDQPHSDCIVLDTSDAQEGLIVNRKPPMRAGEIGSAKKVIEPNDVIISRLRPYLRQVAFVDPKIRFNKESILILCSTEFFVLRSPDESSIAFLVPFLLSEPVQKVLAASQEGGHHPRFNESTLLGLPVPKSLMDDRESISRNIEESVSFFRKSEKSILKMIERAGSAFDGAISADDLLDRDCGNGEE